MDECFFRPCGHNEANKALTSAGPERVQTIIRCSKARHDGLHLDLERQLQSDTHINIKCHKNCVSSYTSKSHIQRHLKRTHVQSNPCESTFPTKRFRRSDTPSFDFKEHCFFCGDVCELKRHGKNPSRRRRAVLCRTADRGNQNTFKQNVLRVCDSRHDDVSEIVKLRLLGVVSDLHAADARYHDECRKRFMSSRSVTSAARHGNHTHEVDAAISVTSSLLKADKSRVWNSLEVYKMYQENGGHGCSRRKVVSKMLDILGPDLLLMSGVGVANLLVFRSTASTVINLVATDDDDATDAAIDKLATTITQESKQLNSMSGRYETRIDLDVALGQSSSTLNSLLSRISHKLHRTCPGTLIGNMITNVITNRPTTLQTALGVLLSRKTIIERMFDFRVCCSYDEVQRFKSSAAKAAVEQSYRRAVADASRGLIQVVADNFDANIASQNGLVSTHSLAMLLAFREDAAELHTDDTTIRRLTRQEMKLPAAEDIAVHRYRGPKKPEMPVQMAQRAVLPLRILAHQTVQLTRSRQMDFDFLKRVTSEENVPEFAGYNVQLCRVQELSVQPATKAMYTPLIDMDPADPDTMLTAMEEAQRMTNECGQLVTIFTNDQQLYRVAVNITWVYPERFSQLIPRLGGMHTLMSFVGCVGKLMADSGLEEVMKAAFGGVTHMLVGKKFPQNVRALRLVTEEVLRPTIGQLNTPDELMNCLEEKATQSSTARLWFENLVKPVFIMMIFVRAEREGDWPLHLWAVREMLPYFFAAAHWHYARYGLFYLRSMEKLDGDILHRFMNGEHVMRHRKGLWNGIWSDMYIETTFMRYGHGPNGIVGITLKPSTLKKWAYSMHTCSQMVNDIEGMSEAQTATDVTSHKEERTARIRADATDRERIREMLQSCIDPLDPTDHPRSRVVNIVTGRIGPDEVNAPKAVEIGTSQMHHYEESWPTGFNATLSNKVVTMAASRKVVRLGNTAVCDAHLIYSRVIGLQHARNIQLSDILGYELAPFPASMFSENGEMRTPTAKSALKKSLQVEISSRLAPQPDVIIVDGCAILWVVHWPNRGTVLDFVRNFASFIYVKVDMCDVYLVFDRYHEFSIKSATRLGRSGQQASRRHKLSLQTPLPSQKVVLTVTENKVQLIDIICQYLIKSSQHEKASHHRLVITGQANTPMEVQRAVVNYRDDLTTTHEEADVIMIQQVAAVANDGARHIKVLSDDTDVFILLVYHFKELNLQCSLTMEGTSSGRALIDIASTVETCEHIIQHLPAAHALTGCDTVAQLWGRGKGTCRKILEMGKPLNRLGDVDADINEVMDEATSFIASCYGSRARGNMSEVRKDVWLTKMAKPKVSTTPALKVLPPTTEAFEQNVRRAHIQTAIWKSAARSNPPAMDPTKFGWERDELSRTLVPRMIPPNTAIAPPEVLQMIRCGCSSENPCYTSHCRCTAAKLPCTVFCACRGEMCCKNERTLPAAVMASDDGSDVE